MISLTWNLRNKTEDHRGREEKNKTRGQSDRKTNHKRLLIIGDKLRVTGRETGVGGWGNWVIGH